MRPTNDEDAIAFIVERVPALRPLLDAHIASYGELLPTLVFEGDFMRWAVRQCGDRESQAAVRDFVDAVDVLLDVGDPLDKDWVWHLAAGAFVETLVLDDYEEALICLAAWFGDATRRSFAHLLSVRPAAEDRLRKRFDSECVLIPPRPGAP